MLGSPTKVTVGIQPVFFRRITKSGGVWPADVNHLDPGITAPTAGYIVVPGDVSRIAVEVAFFASEVESAAQVYEPSATATIQCVIYRPSTAFDGTRTEATNPGKSDVRVNGTVRTAVLVNEPLIFDLCYCRLVAFDITAIVAPAGALDMRLSVLRMPT